MKYRIEPRGVLMTTKLPILVLIVVLSLPAGFSCAANADSRIDGFAWPSHYDYFLPYGSKDGGPVYAKPGYKDVSLTLTCAEAEGILKMRGYRDIAELSWLGDTYRFEVSRV